MKKCLNCKNDVRDSDIYCRTCGCLLKSNSHYVLMNVMTVLVVIGWIGFIALVIASYMITK